MKRTISVKMQFMLLGMLLGMLWIRQSSISSVLAAESANAETGRLMTAERRVEMKETPDDKAVTIMTFEKGSSVFSLGESANGWYQVIYQDKVGYVPENALRSQEMDVEGLNAEMAQEAEEAKFMIETIERYRIEARRSKIWGSVIVILVIGVFATGIIAEIRGRKNGGSESGDGE